MAWRAGSQWIVLHLANHACVALCHAGYRPLAVTPVSVPWSVAVFARAVRIPAAFSDLGRGHAGSARFFATVLAADCFVVSLWSALACWYRVCARHSWRSMVLRIHGHAFTLVRSLVRLCCGGVGWRSLAVTAPNQPMKPTARQRDNLRAFATAPCRGLSLFR